MTKPLPWSGRIALPLLLPAALLPLLFARPRSLAPARPAQPHASRFHDWTTHHAVYGRTGNLAALEAARSDPRALFRWREIEQQGQFAQIEARQRQLQSFLQLGSNNTVKLTQANPN